MENFSPPSNLKGANILESSISILTAYTLVGQVALQKLFNSPANGALRARGGTTYYFECTFDLSAMSATSGTFSFGFLGTATISSIKYTAIATKSAVGTPTAPSMSVSAVATAFPIVVANIATTGSATISGIIRVNATGTLIPSIGLGIASPAVVSANSLFKIYPVGANTATSNGEWS